MMRRYIILLAFVLVFFGIKNYALAFEDGDIQMHGFVSQGYLKSTEHNYLGDTKDGSYEFNEIGVSFAVPVTEDLNFGIQFFSRDIGEIGNNELIVDWAFLTYEWRDWLGFRAGKMKIPFGLYNRERDFDSNRTFILLPQSVYSEIERSNVIGFQGWSFFGYTPMGVMGDLDYELFAGTNASEAPRGAPIEITDITTTKYQGGKLAWITPLKGFMISATDLISEADLDFINPAGGANEEGEVIINTMGVLSARYEYDRFTFAAEYYKLNADLKAEALGGKLPDDRKGWYGSISWDIIDWLSLGAYYGDYEQESFFDNPGNQSYPDYYSYQKDTAISVKFEISKYWSIKLETHFMEGVNQIDDDFTSNMEKDWNLYAVKTSLCF